MEFAVSKLNALIPEGECKIYDLLLSNDHNNELLPFSFIYDSSNEFINFEWSPSEFIEIGKDIVNKQLRSLY
jgi:hypothetical protein